MVNIIILVNTMIYLGILKALILLQILHNGTGFAPPTSSANTIKLSSNHNSSIWDCCPQNLQPHVDKQQQTLTLCGSESESNSSVCPSKHECTQVKTPAGRQRFCCPSRVFVCGMAPNYGLGPCFGRPKKRFYFSIFSRKCEKLTFSGCGPETGNLFQTEEDCEQFCASAACSPNEFALVPPVPIDCLQDPNQCPPDTTCCHNNLTDSFVCCRNLESDALPSALIAGQNIGETPAMINLTDPTITITVSEETNKTQGNLTSGEDGTEPEAPEPAEANHGKTHKAASQGTKGKPSEVKPFGYLVPNYRPTSTQQFIVTIVPKIRSMTGIAFQKVTKAKVSGTTTTINQRPDNENLSTMFMSSSTPLQSFISSITATSLPVTPALSSSSSWSSSSMSSSTSESLSDTSSSSTSSNSKSSTSTSSSSTTSPSSSSSSTSTSSSSTTSPSSSSSSLALRSSSLPSASSYSTSILPTTEEITTKAPYTQRSVPIPPPYNLENSKTTKVSHDIKQSTDAQTLSTTQTSEVQDFHNNRVLKPTLETAELLPAFVTASRSGENEDRNSLETGISLVTDGIGTHSSSRIRMMGTCPLGDPLILPSSSIVYCVNDTHCPDTHSCESGLCCPRKEWVCNMPYNVGMFCQMPQNPGLRWYFDSAVGLCRSFAFLGCGGNANCFLTKQLCAESCQYPELIELSKRTYLCELGPALRLNGSENPISCNGTTGKHECPDSYACEDGVCCPSTTLCPYFERAIINQTSNQPMECNFDKGNFGCPVLSICRRNDFQNKYFCCL